MRVLDGDVHALQSGNVIACRDIVQFVRFVPPLTLLPSPPTPPTFPPSRINDFAHKTQEELAEMVLEEIPEQLLSFMRQHNILPNEA
jgi:hypothetical protein